MVAAVGFVFGFHTSVYAKASAKMSVEPALEVELQAVLDSSVSLHQALFQQNEAEVDVALKEILIRIERSEQKSSLSPSGQTHLLKILDAARGHLEMGQIQSGSDRSKSLQGAFHQLVQLNRIFDLGDYKIYFCSKDRTVWLQKGLKPQNPFNPQRYKNCGRIAQ